MKNRTLLTDVLEVLSPGRRKLKARQNANKMDYVRALERLIREYQSLAILDTNRCDTNALGHVDYDELKHFISCDQRPEEWEAVRTRINEFQLPEMTGGVNPGDQRLIFHLVEYLKPNQSLEIGSHIGASTIHLALGMKRYCDQDTRKLITVDIKNVNSLDEKPWETYGSKYSPSEMIEKLQCDAFVKFINKPSLEFLSNDEQKYDLIFLDGDHSAQTVYCEIPLALARLSEGGCILLHDFFPKLKPLWTDSASSLVIDTHVVPGVFIAVERLLREGCNFNVVPFGELPWATKLGSRVTSLAMISRTKK